MSKLDGLNFFKVLHWRTQRPRRATNRSQALCDIRLSDYLSLIAEQIIQMTW